jgi:predicted ArsR family transcriptional regulator
MIDFSKLDKVIHEKGRLSIMTLLASRAEHWPFQDLKSELAMSDGNLVTHLRTLEKAGYVESEKIEGIGRPQTCYGVTSAGRTAFTGYLKVLEAIVDASR